MQLSMWTYPWDIQDLGMDDGRTRHRERAGLNMISLATSYHAGRFLQPRSPRRKAYFPEDGTIYFRPTAARWANLAIQPKVADVIGKAATCSASLCAGAMRVACGSRAGRSASTTRASACCIPQAVTRNAFGDPNYYNLCPSQSGCARLCPRAGRRHHAQLQAGPDRARESMLHGLRA